MTREGAIKELTHELRVWESECKSAHPTKDALRLAIEALSEEKTDRPKGKWTEDCKCTVCGFKDEDFGLSQIMRCNFCPNCGARMI